MRKYQKTENNKLISVVCNGCGKELQVENGYLKEGCFHAQRVFGYFSEQDGSRHCFDLCEDCYRKLIDGFVVPVEEEEDSELL